MIRAEVNNCNNIISGAICLQNNHLNIRYAMNGIGKSTIALAIELASRQEDLSALQPFDSDDAPTCVLSEECKKVLLFNEGFVDNFVFQESEVIQNSFEVFIKTPQYDEQQASIEDKLKNMHVDVSENADIQQIISVGRYVLSKFSVTLSGGLRQSGTIRSLVQSESLFKLPENLAKFKPLMEKDYTVNWVGWKHDGSKYDDNGICPFCTSGLGEEYESEKSTFTASYTKSNVKNIIEMLSYFDDVEQFMDESAKETLHQCIKGLKGEDDIQFWVRAFYNELDFLVKKIAKLEEFNSYQVRSEDISRLDDQLRELAIDISHLRIFKSKRVNDAVDSVNRSIEAVRSETESLKRDIGQLASLIGSARKNAITDINDFLLTAGISYSFEIVDESESVARTILRYISKTKDPVEVSNINIHLSWGERNAFALVLFMHFALSQDPDLIILDDPISSFDSNKKYAIVNRLFSSKSKRDSFYGKTVLMLTHDLQPIIDFIKVNKPTGASVSAYYLQNESGVISEQEISDSDIKSSPKLLAEDSRNQDLNIVHRVASLRKLLEHTPTDDDALTFAYNMLSCLLHGKPEPESVNRTKLTSDETKSGAELIKQYITDFDYGDYSTKVFTKDNLLRSFNEEKNSYVRLQVFRVLIEVLNLRTKITDDPLLKYIDEQLHVENDYMFSLDLMKFDIVPDFVILKCTEFLAKEHIAS